MAVGITNTRQPNYPSKSASKHTENTREKTGMKMGIMKDVTKNDERVTVQALYGVPGGKATLLKFEVI